MYTIYVDGSRLLVRDGEYTEPNVSLYKHHNWVNDSGWARGDQGYTRRPKSFKRNSKWNFESFPGAEGGGVAIRGGLEFQ